MSTPPAANIGHADAQQIQQRQRTRQQDLRDDVGTGRYDSRQHKDNQDRIAKLTPQKPVIPHA